MKKIERLYVAVGILSVLYCISIMLFTGFGSLFFLIWAVIGIGFFCLAGCVRFHVWKRLPKLLRRIFLLGVVLCLILFICFEGLIVSGFGGEGKENLDYVIVLGAQVHKSGPSKVLKMRLDAAYDYAAENPDTLLVVSGGQGGNEPFSEAKGMYDYLVKRGLEEDRIIMEDKSTNTYENLTFSKEILDSLGGKVAEVGIVSNNFHVYRAVQLARHNGYERVWGIAAPSDPYLQVNNMLREFFGVLKDFLTGHMKLVG
ncbi:MAG: YdcF family protein [Roseburia sp.]|nr:YdcF family protein [Roseburia sp.]MCM1278955.1 YdcF family protein [Robinsoniella sp.]